MHSEGEYYSYSKHFLLIFTDFAEHIYKMYVLHNVDGGFPWISGKGDDPGNFEIQKIKDKLPNLLRVFLPN